jgi:hypothetical protein
MHLTQFCLLKLKLQILLFYKFCLFKVIIILSQTIRILFFLTLQLYVMYFMYLRAVITCFIKTVYFVNMTWGFLTVVKVQFEVSWIVVISGFSRFPPDVGHHLSEDYSVVLRV